MLTATITGKDNVSLQVLHALNQGEKVKNIPLLFPVTIDQAKILSRYRKMLLKTKGKIQEENYQRMTQLGIKVLKLAPLFKAEDWEGMNDVLSVVNAETKRDEIGMFMEALQEKRKRLFHLQQAVNEKREALENKETALRKQQKELERIEKQIEESLAFLKKYPKPIRTFLQEHLGLYQGELVLAKRVDIQWGKRLREKNLVVYDEKEMVHRVRDLDGMAENLQFRNERGYNSYYNKEKAESYYKKMGRETPQSEYYQLPTRLASNLQTEKEQIQEQMKQIKEEQKTVERELKNLRKVKPTSFVEAVEVRQILNLKDTEQHGKLQHIALKWLLENDYVALAEFVLPNKKVVDVIGYSRKGRVVIVEAKASWEDWVRDEKWENYMEYADEFYFIVPSDVYKTFQQKEDRFWETIKVRKEAVGILVWDSKNLILKKSSDGHMKVKHPTELLFELAKKASYHYIHGK